MNRQVEDATRAAEQRQRQSVENAELNTRLKSYNLGYHERDEAVRRAAERTERDTEQEKRRAIDDAKRDAEREKQRAIDDARMR